MAQGRIPFAGGTVLLFGTLACSIILISMEWASVDGHDLGIFASVGRRQLPANQQQQQQQLRVSTMQWDEQCFATLFSDKPPNGTAVEDTCQCVPPHAGPPSTDDTLLSIVEIDSAAENQENSAKHENNDWHISVAQLPASITVTVRSEAPPCSDILDVTLFEDSGSHGPLFSVTQPPTPSPTMAPTASPTANTTSTPVTQQAEASSTPGTTFVEPLPDAPLRRAVPGSVLARADGTYHVSLTVVTEGTHDLLVRLAYRRWVPLIQCRAAGCREVYDAPEAGNYTKSFPYITQRIRVSHMAANTVTASRGLTEHVGGANDETQACSSADAMMARGGSWVRNPNTMLGYTRNASATLVPAPSDGDGWQATWQPRACRLQLYEPKDLQQLFHGKHFLVIGDSTTHMLMATMMHLILGPDFRYPTNGYELCGHNNRVYDSGDMLFPIRFSFVWAGSAHYCGNHGGLPSIVETEEGLTRFCRGLGRDVDFVVMNSGAHDLTGGTSLEDYDRLLPEAFELVRNTSARIRANPQRLLWRSTTTHAYNVGDWNAGIRWMNILAERQARQYGFAVLDSQQMWAADTELRRANGLPLDHVFCGDGLHGRGDRNIGTETAPQWKSFNCDKLYTEAAIAVQHFTQLARREQGS